MKKINQWTSYELAAQMVFPRLLVKSYLENVDYKSRITKLVSEGIGGFCIFGGNVEENIKVTNELQIFAEIPLLFCGDFENGISMRLSEGTEFPHMMALGAAGKTEYTKKCAALIALEAKVIGAHWNLAPVADINNNPQNPVINVRSFGDTSDIVSQNVKAYIEGTQNEKVLACVKHFPGHGNTVINSHLDLPVLNLTRDELEKNEFIPFKTAIAQGVKSIMVGHLVISDLDKSNLPATLSKNIITGILKDEMGFDGLVVTDALEMKAITENYSDEEIAELSVKAGNNVLLMPANDEHLIELIAKLADENTDYRSLLINSCEKIIAEKRWTGIMPQYHREDMNSNLFTEHPYKALKYAYYALKTEGDDSLIPLKDIKSLAVFSLLQRSENFDKASQFMKMLGDATEFDIDFGYLDENLELEHLKEIQKTIFETELILFPIFFRNFTEAKEVTLPENLKKAIDILSGGRKSILVFFGSPYFANDLNADTRILTYSDSYASIAAVVVKLSDRSIDWIED
ncbi:MAG: hypothetical protein A2X64_02985 [Ignavibacteria bacterium GWF2_33_9]|nr:MAG: hypothetical protein A2X64_02985 [Ignavibacteria bacterium GWF2_33_9]